MRVALAMTIAAMLASLSAVGAAKFDRADLLWRYRNLGKAFYENPTTKTEAVEEFRKALELAPNSARERVNYGLALLRAGKVDEGIAQLQKVEQQDPTIPYPWFNLGIEFKHRGNNAAAIEQFEAMTRLVPEEPVSHFNLGILYRLVGKSELALAQFELAEKLDPNLAGPHFQLFNEYRQAGRSADAARELAVFNRLKRQPVNDAVPEDLEWSPYAEIYDTVPRGESGNTAPAPARLAVRKIGSLANVSFAGLSTLDVYGDGTIDLLAWSRDGIQLFRRGVTRIANTGLEDIRDVSYVAPGDLNNDGLPDLCVLTSAGAALYINRGGKFEPLNVQLPAGKFTRAVWIDYDHDYDLDLFLLGEKSYLLRNEGTAGFEDQSSRFPFVAGSVLDATVFELYPDAKERDLAVAYSNRPGVIYRDRQGGRYDAVPLDLIPAGASSLISLDFNNDGWMDIAAEVSGGVRVLANREGKLEEAAMISAANGPAVAADFGNRGVEDLVAGRKLMRNRAGRFTPDELAIPEFRVVAAADFDGDGRTDLAALTPEGDIDLLFNRTDTANHWLTVQLAGVKNLKLAAGSVIELKAGDVYQKRIYQGVPLSIGLRDEAQIDTVRITWANGLVQNEIRPEADRTVLYREKPRLSGSCPMIFSWNGRRFAFVSDVLGVAPLGASDGDGNYFPVNHREYVKIPPALLHAHRGAYDLRITEELHEVSYLDQLQLIAVDHPTGMEVFTNDKFKGPPFPEHRMFGIRKKIYPRRATDQRGRDVLRSIVRRDNIYAAGFHHDSSGVAETHSIELDFAKAAPDNRALLVLNGWVDWADGSTFFARAQEGKGREIIFPYLQAQDAAGNWQTVIADMGIPSGKPRSIVVDLSGKFLSRSRKVRIVTNLCVYWDEIYLSEDTAPPELRITALTAQDANLHFRGFSRTVIDPARAQPEKFIYAENSSTSSWNPIPGLYTRYGDTTKLVAEEDDRMVVMGSGDELRLRFDSSRLLPVAAGWTRDFFVMVDGWAKDSDSNTAYSESVEPLPFHGMSAYPYPLGERFPDDELHRRYRAEYLTRPALRLLRPLVDARRETHWQAEGQP